MKHSQSIGIIMALALIVSCYLPWCFIASENWLITGMNTMGTHYGKPGIVHIAIAAVAVIFFSIQKLWSKRTNIFLLAINTAWCVRNFILMGTCAAGDCPEKKYGLYMVVAASVVMFIMSFLPKISLKEN